MIVSKDGKYSILKILSKFNNLKTFSWHGGAIICQKYCVYYDNKRCRITDCMDHNGEYKNYIFLHNVNIR